MLLILLGLWLICGKFLAVGRNYPECNGNDKLETFVASKKSCAKYIFCNGEASFEGECLGDNIFNEKEGNCDDPKGVECFAPSGKGNVNSNIDNDIDNENKNNNNNNNKNGTNIDTNKPNILTNPPQPMLPSTPSDLSGVSSVANNGNALPSLYPSNEFVKKPQCPQSYDQTNLIHLPNPISCASYYTCYNGIAIPMICGRNMYFSKQNGKCEPQEQVDCVVKRPVQLQCLKGIYDFMPHPWNCHYYYFCSNGFLMILQCPFKFTWHYERRTCVHQSQSKCIFTSQVKKSLLV